MVSRNRDAGGLAASGLEMGKEIPGSRSRRSCHEKLATSGLRHPAGDLSSHNHRPRREELNGSTYDIFLALALAQATSGIARIPFLSWASRTLSELCDGFLPDRFDICYLTVKVHVVQLEHAGQTPHREFVRAFSKEIQFNGARRTMQLTRRYRKVRSLIIVFPRRG
jgi:hypothetical protein